MVDAETIINNTGVDLIDVERAVELGLVSNKRGDDGKLMIAQADVWRFEVFGQVRKLGFKRELGFSMDDLLFYEELASKLFQEEVRLIFSRLSKLPPADVAQMIERVLPLIHSFIARHHATQVRDFFGNLL